MKKNKENFDDKRWKDLPSPILYKNYFNPIKINDFSTNVFQPNMIMISIASYRDDQCFDTVKNLSENADHPELLHFIVCQQNSISDRDCFPRNLKSKITIERLTQHQAMGPTYARFRIQQRWSGEQYFLQVDAHTRMVKSWDTICKNQLSLTSSNKPILTQYPLSYDIVEREKRNDPKAENWQTDKLRGGLYVQKFDNPDGFTRIQSDYTTTMSRNPFKAIAWAAGFSFSDANIIKDAGYDPYTPFLFFGEEMDITIRAYTHGWDFYSPSVNIAFHNYKRDHRKTFWENPSQKPLEVLSRFRVYKRLGYVDEIPDKYKFILIGIDQWPIGKERTVEDYENEAGISIEKEELD